MGKHRSLDPREVEELLTVLANPQCRAIVGYFRETSENVAPVDDLVDHVRTKELEGVDREKESVAIRLHHATLPRLGEAGVIDYDTRSGAVRYRGHPRLEALFDSIADF